MRNQTRPLLSLFAGAGGLDLGFEQAGFSPLLALDVDPAAVATYNWNRREREAPARVADLAEVRPEAILRWWQEVAGAERPAGIIGGPPCQAFSVSNVHRLRDDPRARLPLAYARILDVFAKKLDIDFFVFENVAGLANKPHSDSLEQFIDAFCRAGFSVTHFFLDAAEFAVPQRRRRMFIVGFNLARFPVTAFFPPAGNNEIVTAREAIGHLREPLPHSRGADPRSFGLHPNHWCLNPRSPKFRNGKLQPGKMLGRSFRMLSWDEPSWTVAYGHREVHVHPEGHRRLSVFEAMLLQGFPPEYELLGTLTDQIRLVSDAVPPPVARALGETIRSVLDGGTRANGKAHDSRNGHSKQLGLKGLHTAAPRSTRA